MNDGLNKDNIMSLLPSVLANDESMNALADAITDQLVEQDSVIDDIRIYTKLDSLSEELCDILARDLDVRWYDYDAPIEEKRKLIKSTFWVHKHLGTVGAVEIAIAAIYDGTSVSEWFQYGGNPYHFRILVDVSKQLFEKKKHASVLERLETFKNKRSVFDGMYYWDPGTQATEYWFTGELGEDLVDSCITNRPFDKPTEYWYAGFISEMFDNAEHGQTFRYLDKPTEYGFAERIGENITDYATAK